jgi:eukaryotic-like serine/threonine-protein kinase
MSHFLNRRFCRPQYGQKFHVGDDEYELRGKIGDGAVGVVRKVVRLRDEASRAIKFLAPDPKYIEESVFDDVAARFTREGERGARLDYPFLLKVHNYIPNQNGVAFATGSPKNPFLIMQLVGGKTLERYIHNLPKEAPGSFMVNEEKLDISLQLVEGMEYLHKKKLIHRDVKPANVFLPRPGIGRLLVRLGDFGIVKWGDFHASLSTGVLTATNQRGLGTLKYMSPEQAIAPKNVGAKSDIYSLGITLFELFAGRILASPHHVFEIMSARLARGSTFSRFLSMQYRLEMQDLNLGELLLDMHLRGIKGRPSIDRVRGVLRRAYENLTGREWRAPV